MHQLTELLPEHSLPFVGASRLDALQQIEGAFDHTVETGLPLVVVIAGISGSGKTRLVQEFFNQISIRQAMPNYWPPQFSSHQAGVSLLKSRNQIHPSGQVNPAAKRSFSWYAQACRRSSDESSVEIQNAFEANRKLIEQHPKRKIQRVNTYIAITVIVVAITIEFVDNFVSLSTPLQWCARLAGASSFGLGIWDGWRRLRENRANTKPNDNVDGSSVANVIGDSYALIRAEVERFRTPTIVFIDEWHWADSEVRQFVLDLLDLDGPCLILLTRWLTGNSDDKSQQDADDVESSAFMTIELTQLQSSEVTEIIKDEKPGYPISVLEAIADHSAGNPLVALKLCSMPQVVALEGESIDDSEIQRVISELPYDHDGILREQWKAVPLEVQQFLCIASVFGEVIPTELVKKAFSDYFDADSDRALQLAREPYWWLQILQSDVDMFPEPSLYRIAKGEAVLVLSRDKLRELEVKVASTPESQLPMSMRMLGVYGDTIAERKFTLRLAQGLKTTSLEDALLVWYKVFTLGGSRFVNLRQQFCQEQIDWLTDNPPSIEQVLEHNALLTQFKYYFFKSVAANDPAAGNELGLKLLSEIGNHILKADLLLRLGNNEIKLGNYDSADKYYVEVLKLKPPRNIAEATNANRLLVMTRTGRIKEAIRAQTLDRRRRIMRVVCNSPFKSLSTRIAMAMTNEEVAILVMGHNIGSWYGRSGDYPKALKFFRRTLDRVSKMEITAENREKIWLCKASCAYWQFKAGMTLEALKLLTDITSDRSFETEISREHEEAISAVQLYAATLAYRGLTSEASAALRHLTRQGSLTGIRLSREPGLVERQEFIESNLHDPETLMRDL